MKLLQMTILASFLVTPECAPKSTLPSLERERLPECDADPDRWAAPDHLEDAERPRDQALADGPLRTYEVPRTVIEGLLTAPASVGRALLSRGPDGNFDGYRISGVRPRSPADVLGIENGDILHTVNGLALDSVQSALQAYRTMLEEDLIVLELTRDGEPVLLRYELW